MAEQTFSQYTNIAIGDIGTQLYVYNEERKVFEYFVPVTAGADFGGDTESFEARETDLPYVAKVGGLTILDDITYTVNYTAEKYRRVEDKLNNIKENVYMEVLQDDSAMIFRGTGGMPTLTGGDVRQINMTIMPSFLRLIFDIKKLEEKDIDILNALNDGETSAGIFYNAESEGKSAHIRIDIDSIPTMRRGYGASKVADTVGEGETAS